MAEAFALAAGDATATVSADGAELISWSVAGRDLLWRPDPRFWARTCPILFPVVGRSRDDAVSIGGASFPMPLHGFAAACRFAPVEASGSSLTLRLSDDEATAKHYPFQFALDVSFRLQGIRLSVEFLVGNRGNSVMPYALGFHPGFRTSPGALLLFDADEDPDVPRVTAEGLLSRATWRTPLAGRRLDITDDLLSRGALCFLGARSRTLRLEQTDGSRVEVGAEGFPHWAVWGKPGAPFVCLEAWTGHADFEDFRGDLADRPSMRLLPPGATAFHALAMTVEGS